MADSLGLVRSRPSVDDLLAAARRRLQRLTPLQAWDAYRVRGITGRYPASRSPPDRGRDSRLADPGAQRPGMAARPWQRRANTGRRARPSGRRRRLQRGLHVQPRGCRSARCRRELGHRPGRRLPRVAGSWATDSRRCHAHGATGASRRVFARAAPRPQAAEPVLAVPRPHNRSRCWAGPAQRGCPQCRDRSSRPARLGVEQRNGTSGGPR